MVFKRYLDSLCVRYPRVMARLMCEWPLVSVANLYKKVEVASCSVDAHELGIPRNIYQTWLQPELGKSHAASLAHFKSMNPDCSFWLYGSPDMDAYMQQYYGTHPIYEVYTSAQFGPVKTDIWRYCILFERGGFYFDINKMVDVPLNTIVDPTDVAVISYEKNSLPAYLPKGPAVLAHPDRLILNWGFGFAKGHPVLAAVINNIVADYPKFKNVRVPNVKEAVLNLTGPHQLTKTIHKLSASSKPAMREADIDFYGHGNANIRGSWVRYAAMPSYSRATDGVIVT